MSKLDLSAEEMGHFTNADNEAESVQAIKTHLLTEQERKKLYDANLSIEDVLNGRFDESHSGLIEEELFPAWNEKLGYRHFGF